MLLFENISMAVSGLLANKMRALLTMFEDEDLYNIFMESMLGSYDSHSMFIPAGTC